MQTQFKDELITLLKKYDVKIEVELHENIGSWGKESEQLYMSFISGEDTLLELEGPLDVRSHIFTIDE